MWRGHASARSRGRPANPCGGGLAGCTCNIDDTAACFVGYRWSILTQVLFPVSTFFLLHCCEDNTLSIAVSEKKSTTAVVVLWALQRHMHPTQASTTPRPGGVNGQPSRDCRRAQSTHAEAAAAAAAATWCLTRRNFLLNQRLARSRWFLPLVLFKFLEIWFQFKSKIS